jgi:hypothetical protein
MTVPRCVRDHAHGRGVIVAIAPSIWSSAGSSGRLSRFPALVDHACVVGLIPDFYLQAGRLLMTRRLTLAFLSVIFVRLSRQ